MKVVRVFDCKGWSAEQYDELIRRMDLGGHSAPGVLFHVAGPTSEGFRATASTSLLRRRTGSLRTASCRSSWSSA